MSHNSFSLFFSARGALGRVGARWGALGRIGAQFSSSPNEYDKVILLVRDPFDTLLAEWNRQNSGESHIGIAPIKSFSNKKKWKKYVAEQLKLWQNFYTYYVDEYQVGSAPHFKT